MIAAAIDIGTNTVLMLIGKKEKDGKIKILRDELRLVRLGEGVDRDGEISSNAMKRMEACFQDYRKILDEEFSIPIKIISGKEEATLSFAGALWGKEKNKEYLVIDIGGGSTEFVGMGDERLSYHSFSMGCVRIHERFFHHDPPTEEEIVKARNFIRDMISSEKDFFLSFQKKKILALAGTATYMASSILGLQEFQEEKIHAYRMYLKDILSMKEHLLKLSAKERLGIGAMDKGRADVIIAGAIILEESMQALGASEVEVSTQGLRHGLLLQELRSISS